MTDVGPAPAEERASPGAIVLENSLVRAQRESAFERLASRTGVASVGRGVLRATARAQPRPTWRRPGRRSRWSCRDRRGAGSLERTVASDAAPGWPPSQAAVLEILHRLEDLLAACSSRTGRTARSARSAACRRSAARARLGARRAGRSTPSPSPSFVEDRHAAARGTRRCPPICTSVAAVDVDERVVRRRQRLREARRRPAIRGRGTAARCVSRCTAPSTPWLRPAITRTVHALRACVNSGISALWMSRYQGARILSLRRQVEPQLEAFHPAVFLLGQFGVDHAAAGRHPLHAAVLQQAFVAGAVAMAHAARRSCR